jgi:Putative peptidoglycan binding domain
LRTTGSSDVVDDGAASAKPESSTSHSFLRRLVSCPSTFNACTSRPLLKVSTTYKASVVDLQCLLKNNAAGLPVDGYFGSKTEAAVKLWQQKKNLGQDGIVGSKTWPTLCPAGSGGSGARTLTTSEVQAGLDAYTKLQGGSFTATQTLFDKINTATKAYSLYRQLAFDAQTIWESGGYKYTEELAAITYPYTARDKYKDCD